MKSHDPKHVLIAGGGVAALETALALRALAEDRVAVELLAPEPLFWYRPLAVAEPFRLGQAGHFNLPELADAAGASFTTGALASVDVDGHLAHTFGGTDIPFDVLLIACGAVPIPAIPWALTFRGPTDTADLEGVLADVAAGEVRRLVFAVPSGIVWTLGAYELALLTADWASSNDVYVELTLVTPEEEPLGVFGPAASAAVAELLDASGVALRLETHPVAVARGELLVVNGEPLPADRVIALPRLRGRRIDGITQSAEGFTPVDVHGRVFGAPDVYAAGDATTFPLKQGGIAAQQADAAAEFIAAEAGVRLRPTPFSPVLRGLLLTGRQPVFMRRELTHDPSESLAGSERLWWPPAKIVGRHLAPFLGMLAGVEIPRDLEVGPDVVPVHVELDVHDTGRHAALAKAVDAYAADDQAGASVLDAMTGELVLVGSGDPLADAVAAMREHAVDVAMVVDDRLLVGILTAQDVLRAVAVRADLRKMRVRHFMTAEPLTVAASTSAGAAVYLMTEYGVHHLPVMDGETPVGVITLGDAGRAARTHLGIGLGF